MKNNLLVLLSSTFILTFLSCTDIPKQKTENKNIYSKNQQYLFDVLENYKSEYFATKNQGLRDTIQNKYLKKLRYFLVDSLKRHLDSINVTVDTVIQKGRLVTTQFHSGDIEFKYGLEFKDSMDSRTDSIYQWMRGLKPKSNLTLSFALLGSGQLNYPDDSTRSIIKIFALPEPLTEGLR